MNAADYYKANVGLVHAVSRRGYARLMKAKVGIDYEDVFQEMSVVFLKAYERFDESRGFKFSTYYYMSAMNRLNSWAQDMIDERLNCGVISIQELNAGKDGDDDMMLEEQLLVDATTPEDHLRVKEYITHMTNTLSPLAALILGWSIEPPQEIMQEIRAAQAYAAFGRSKGFDTRCMAQISPRFIGNFIHMVWGVPNFQVTQALKEIDRIRYADSQKFVGE